MIWSITLNGVVGLSMYIAVLFCAGDIDAAINSSYVYPFVEIVLQATSSRAGSAVIAAIIVIVFFGLVIGVVAASSRMLWAFARDRGVPCWTWLRQVSNPLFPDTYDVLTGRCRSGQSQPSR